MSALFGFLTRSFGWLIAIIGFLVRALLITWATLAIYYSNLPWAWARLGLAVAFALFAIWSLWFSRRACPRQPPCCFFAWLDGGLPSPVHIIATGVRKSRSCRGRPSTAIASASPASAISTIAHATISRCAMRSARCGCRTSRASISIFPILPRGRLGTRSSASFSTMHRR